MEMLQSSTPLSRHAGLGWAAGLICLPHLLLTDPREFDILQSGLAGERTECDSFGRDLTAEKLTEWARLSGSTI